MEHKFTMVNNCSSPYYIVYGKEPIDTELKELEELHRHTGTQVQIVD